MITGIIAAVILIAVLPPGIANGEWGAVAVAVVVALLLLAVGVSSRESDRAYLNATRYWASKGKREQASRSERSYRVAGRTTVRSQEVRDARRRMTVHEARMLDEARKNPDVRRCDVCGFWYEEVWRKADGHGNAVIGCVCPHCGKEKRLKVKAGAEPGLSRKNQAG